MKKNRKNSWGATMRNKSAKYDLSKLSRADIEKISLESAKRIVAGKDNLKSIGKSGTINTRFGVLHYRSNLEKSIFKILDELHYLVATIQNEPIIIPYFFKKLTHHYVPDLLLRMTNNKVWLLEIKPAKLIGTEKNQSKFAAARKWCKRNGNHLRFNVISTTNKKKIEKLLLLHDGVPLLRS